MPNYANMIKDLRAKNFKEEKIKELVLEKSKTEVQSFQVPFKSFSVKADEGAEAWKTIEIEGYASTKDIDRYGDVVNPEAFEDTIDTFMANPVMLLQHDHNKRIGDFTELSIDDKGLYVKGDVKYTAGDAELFEKIENKSLRGFSIGFRVLEAEFQDLTDEKGNVIDWIFIIKKLDLIEISVVNVPANPFTLMKSLENLATKSFKAVVKDSEEVEEEITDTNENANDSDNSNDNGNEKEIKGKDFETSDKEKEADKEEVKTEDQEEDKEEEKGVAEDENNEEEEKNIDDADESDILEDEGKDSENQPETEGAKSGDDSKAFTTKMVEKIVDAKMGGNKQEVKSLVEKEVKNLTKEFDKQLKAVKSDLEKEIDALVEAIKSVKETEEELVSKIKSTIKGKGFINMKTTAQKEEADNRLNRILSAVKNNKKHF